MSDDNIKKEESFSREYVENLRSENASWRRKFQETNARLASLEIGSVLRARGAQAEPSWVQRAEGQTVEEAVDAFLAKHPHLVQGTDAPVNEKKVMPLAPNAPPRVPKADGPGTGPGGGSPGPRPVNAKVAELQEIKADPQKRAEYSAKYRDMLRQSGGSVPPE